MSNVTQGRTSQGRVTSEYVSTLTQAFEIHKENDPYVVERQ